ARRPSVPWHDLLTLAALGLVALGLSIIAGIGFPNFASGALPLPPLAAAQDPAQQFLPEPQASDQGQPAAPGDPGQAGDQGGAVQGTSGQPGAADPQVLQALADALRDQGATRAAAQALDRGDVAGAARELRQLADQAGQLGQSAREELAGRLRDAAGEIAGRNQQLRDQLRQSAAGLEQDGQSAAQALDDLARAIEQLQSGQPDQASQAGQGQDQSQGDQQGQGNGQNQNQGQGGGSGAGSGPGGEQRQANPSDRLGVEGQPVPLESAGAGTVPAQPSGPLPQVAGPGGSTGFTQGDSSSGRRVQIGADPLRVPIDERDVVQDYFQP
ncbi:MAG TPA: hypothetical protein VF897_05050, partial [Roseiflexaceae bacterium]